MLIIVRVFIPDDYSDDDEELPDLPEVDIAELSIPAATSMYDNVAYRFIGVYMILIFLFMTTY